MQGFFFDLFSIFKALSRFCSVQLKIEWNFLQEVQIICNGTIAVQSCPDGRRIIVSCLRHDGRLPHIICNGTIAAQSCPDGRRIIVSCLRHDRRLPHQLYPCIFMQPLLYPGIPAALEKETGKGIRSTVIKLSRFLSRIKNTQSPATAATMLEPLTCIALPVPFT